MTMAENSKIEWTHHTANLWWGCTKVHAGCDNCYAETLSHRWDFDVWGNDKPRRMIAGVWKDLASFQKKAKEAGEMHRVFVGSMMDIFEKPFILVDHNAKVVTDGIHDYPADSGQLRDQLFEQIDQGYYPNLLFLLLTKRPSNINKMIPESWKENPPANVMFGTSPCDQETFDTLWPQLAQVNGKRFLSVEPMLGAVKLKAYCPYCKGMLIASMSQRCGTCHSETIRPDWVICGGESGPGKRPMKLWAAREVRNDCKFYDVPFFMKQIDKVQPIPDDLLIRQFPNI